jgi:UPF0716 protein FxsA
MTIVRRAVQSLLLLPAAELLVFVAVAVAIGFWNAVLLSLATSVLGILLLRSASGISMQRLRTSVASTATMHSGSADLFTGLAGILLIIPGFVTDLIALALLVPGLRGYLGRTIARMVAPSSRQDPSIVDLDPDEWRHETPGESPQRRVGKLTD